MGNHLKHRERKLGMDRDITRRDFISGVGVAITGSVLTPWGVVGEA